MKNLTVSLRRYEISLGLIYIAFQIFILPVVLVIINHFLPTPLSDAELNFACFAINFICVTVIFHRYLIDSLQILKQAGKQIYITGLRGLGLYWLGTILINALVIYLDPTFSNVNDNTIATLTEENSQLMIIGAVILVPVVEETLYRGVVFGGLYRKSPVFSYIISVAVFAALHVVGYIGFYSPVRLILCFLQYIPAGIVLAWVYAKADTIWVPIFIHMTINLIGMLVM